MSEIIYYWKGSAESRQDVLNALEGWGYQLRELRTLDQILDGVKREPPVLIIVDGSASDLEASQRIVELSTSEPLYSYPLLLISRQAKKRSDALETHFKQVIPVDLPFTVDSLMLQVETVTHPESVLQATGGQTTPNTQSVLNARQLAGEAPATVLREEPRKEPSKRDGLKRIEDNTERIRNRVQANPDPLRLDGNYGGEIFALARHPDDFINDSLYPSGPQRPTVIGAMDTLAAKNPWLATHGKRIAYVTAAMLTADGVKGEREQQLRIAGLFIGWGLASEPSKVACYDVLRAAEPNLQPRIIQSYKASAAYVRQTIQADGAAHLIEVAADLLAGKSTEQNADVRSDAALILAVDLASRSCWGRGHWHPHGVYRAMQGLRSQDFMRMVPDLSGKISKMLAEAVSTHITVGNSFLAQLDDDFGENLSSGEQTALNEAAISAAMERAERLGSKSTQVPLSEIAPGMLLLSPLLARDGRLVLQANIVMDEEIVLALWQLAAVRALQPTVHVAVVENSMSSSC